MPRKSIDVGQPIESTNMHKATRKTERSHEENQERAYIAASRRADRSVEARLQSARQASEIHKKRTGKGFKISEQIVVKEEMYEEEDDNLPRSIHLLNAHMQTPSADLNSRLESYLSNKVAFSNALAQSNMAWRSNEVNRAFAESFPHAMPQMPQPQSQSQGGPQHQTVPQQHQNVYQQHPTAPQQYNLPSHAIFHQSPEDYSPTTAYSPTTYSPTSFSPAPFSPGISPAMGGTAPVPSEITQSPRPFISHYSIQPRIVGRGRSSRASSRASVSSPAASPAGKRRKSNKSGPAPRKASVSAASTPKTPASDYEATPGSMMPSNEPMVPSGSAFTTALPAEARMFLGGVGADDVMNQTIANQEVFCDLDQFQQAWVDPLHLWGQASLPRAMDQVDPALVPDLYGNGTDDGMASRCAMPATPATTVSDFTCPSETALSAPSFAEDESWDVFIDDSVWPIHQQ